MVSLIVMLGGVGLVVVVGLVVFLRWTVGSDARRDKVLAEGAEGTARILGWERTGASHGGNDILRFSLAIRPRGGGSEFQATADRLVRPMDAPLFQVGMQRPVRFLHEGANLRVELE
ncbi:hypothetical protein LZ198_03155 [Myxococcus sp. K15C18031901]|uniref:hypothetical protein n=1 Tax=Myxococcus dinghuensis TaxID=2906761 RepID=UPI0020A70CE0|nr:hypothetical protein [Myxococcus dinghuensis]MCP3097869.1 hypothetical protein [Myxococcus dinghuensis]